MQTSLKERTFDKAILANVPSNKEIPVVQFPVRLWWDHFRITEQEIDSVWVEQQWMKDNPQLAKPTAGFGLPEVHVTMK